MERSEHGEEQQKAEDSTNGVRMTAAVREGDEPAFARIADRHRRELQVHCYRMLGSLHDSEDAVQETLLRAWRYRESLREDAPLRPWLYRIATNVCLDAVFRIPPEPGTWKGRDTMIQSWIEGGFGSSELGELRCIPTRANRQPAIACYRRREGETVARPLAMDVLRVEEGQITEIITFSGELFDAFGLPGTLT